jgi:integrase
LAKAGRLTQERVREILSRGVDGILASVGRTISSTSAKTCLEEWLDLKRMEASEKTFLRYRKVIEQLLEFLGPRADRDITLLTAKELNQFKSALSKRLSPATVNVAIKIIRSALNHAHVAGYVQTNEAKKIAILKGSRQGNRKAFTLSQLKRILKVADEEWRGMILVGLYSGLRLGDVATLTWSNIDTENRLISVPTEKTGRHQVLPIAKPVMDYLEQLPAGDDPDAPLFPHAFGAKQRSRYGGTLSNQFYQILVAAGLAKPRPHLSKGKGRDRRRETGGLSFHSLRHTATSLLKNAGVSDVVARDIIGHESAAVSRIYTHIDDSTKRAAIEKMPDITIG